MTITVVGLGFVGLAYGILLSRQNPVRIYDRDAEKVEMYNSDQLNIFSQAEFTIASRSPKPQGLYDKQKAYTGSDMVVVAVSTDGDSRSGLLDTANVNSVIQDALDMCPNATIVIKSTVPIGFTRKINELYNTNQIIYAPEFLRESSALYDCFNPGRIIIGHLGSLSDEKAAVLMGGCDKKNIPMLFTNPEEAESIKLFSNSYLAMRVAFFNELDSFAETCGISSETLINGVCLDPRIGNWYNNPSFGYGGYCLPKDCAQLVRSLDGLPSTLISSVTVSNDARKKYIADNIEKMCQGVIGIYRLLPKNGASVPRNSALQDIAIELEHRGRELLYYEPLVPPVTEMRNAYINCFNEFATRSDLIIANRITDELKPFTHKIYTRDLLHRD